jgi:plastocyanin
MRRLSRVTGLSLLLLASGFVLASCGGNTKKNPVSPGGGGGGTADLVIHITAGSAQAGSNAFSPNPATVTVGQTIQWVNDDGMTHTATADGGSFNTGNVGSGASSSITTMSTQGSFPYHCAVAGHNMTGTVTVNP